MRTQFRIVIIPLSILMLLIGLGTQQANDSFTEVDWTGDNPTGPSLQAYTPRTPFTVDGNDTFSIQGFSGSGTEANPYVIDDVLISVSPGVFGITIRNTDAYFVINNSRIVGSQGGGVFLDNATNGKIRNSSFELLDLCIQIQYSDNCSVEYSKLENVGLGVYIILSDWFIFKSNIISGTSRAALTFAGAGNSTVSNNIITDIDFISGLAGIHIAGSGNTTFTDNIISRVTSSSGIGGVYFQEGDGHIIANNTLTYGDGQTAMLYVYKSNWTDIRQNSIDVTSGSGLSLQDFHHGRIRNNTVSRSSYEGIYAISSVENLIVNNTIYGCGHEAIRIHDLCARNEIYNNKFGWSGWGIARDTGLTGIDIDHWDDSAGVGNSWSDYIGPGVRTIFDSAGAVDNYPTTWSDNSLPTISSPDNITIAWNQESVINWSISDNYPYTYQLFVEDSLVEEGYWFSGFHEEMVTGFSEGLYNFTLSLEDAAGNSVSDTVFVSIEDSDPPNVDSPDDIIYEQGSSGNDIVWTLGDRNPGFYRVEGNGTTVGDTVWTNGTITVDIDDFTPGTYNHTIVVLDQYGNEAKDTVFVIVEDTTPPLVVTSGDFSYNVGTTGHEITWTLGDLNPHEYRIDGNGSTIGWTAWANGTVTLGIDGHSVGIYNHTISVVDDYGNIATDTIFVTVTEDTTVPEVDVPSGIDYEQGELNNEINWTVGDINPSTYSVVGNGTTVSDIAWTNGTITLNVDGLSPGVYNHTIIVIDAYGNQARSTVFVTVHDTVDPDLDSPPDLFYEQGSDSNAINWTVGDRNPGIYRIDGNATTLVWTAWTNGTISMNVDGLALGTYNFTITILDLSDNSVQDTVYVIVEDTTLPSLDSPIDVEYEIGETGNTITWTVSDLNPDFYELYVNELLNETAPWSGSSIVIDIDGLSIGQHNFTLVVFDTSGLPAIDVVQVTVSEIPTTTISTTTTPSTTTTTTSTSPTDTTTTTSGTTTPTGTQMELPLESIVLILGAAGAVVVLIVIIRIKKN